MRRKRKGTRRYSVKGDGKVNAFGRQKYRSYFKSE